MLKIGLIGCGDMGLVHSAAEGCCDFPEGFPFSMSYVVKFEQATAVYDSSATPSLIVYSKKDEKIIPEIEPYYQAKADAGKNVSSLGGYYNELQYFTKSLIDGTSLTVSSLSEAVKSARLVWKEIELCGSNIKNDIYKLN